MDKEFIITTNITELSEFRNRQIATLKMCETLKRSNYEISSIKEEIKFLDFLLNDVNQKNANEVTNHEIKITLQSMTTVKKKYQNKFVSDFSAWKTEKLMEVDIPNLINIELDRIFNDNTFLFTEYRSFDVNTLHAKREELFNKIYDNITDYIVKERGDISIEIIQELIKIQLSVILKSYMISRKEVINREKIPPRELKNFSLEVCNKLISEGKIKSVLNETRKNKAISSHIITELSKKYILTESNKTSISDYFRKGELLIKKNSSNVLTCIDTYNKSTT